MLVIQIGVEVQEELVIDRRMFIEWIGDYVVGVLARIYMVTHGVWY